MPLRLHTIGPIEDMEIVIDRFPFVIGRRSESDCALPLACISRQHCKFSLDGEQIQVQDMKSFNGTFVNGRRAIEPLPLEHGDELSLGPLQFRVITIAANQETVPCTGKTRGDGSIAEQEDVKRSSDVGKA